MAGTKKYLVIKHGALGDFILATGPFAAIRRRHPKSHIILLTTKAFAEMGEQCGYFDEVWIDPKPKIWEIDEVIKLLRRLRGAKFKMVYDLQTSQRTNWYFRFIGRKKPLWSGIIDWCSHPHLNPLRKSMHTIERQAEQLGIAGIKHVPKPNVEWLKSDISKFKLEQPYALFVTGGSPHRPEKRWTREGFAKVARAVRNKGITPVFIGTEAEQLHVRGILSLCNGAVDLTHQTNFGDVAELARHAAFAVGNDTGPIHIIALTGCPTIALFSETSDPTLCAPQGKNVHILQEEDLNYLRPRDVLSLLDEVVDLDSTGKV